MTSDSSARTTIPAPTPIQAKHALMQSRLFLNSAGVAISAGKIGVLGIYVEERKSLWINLIKRVSAALRNNQVTGITIARFDRRFAIGRVVFPIMASETTVPIFVPDLVGMRSPVHFDFGEEVGAINLLRLANDRIRLARIGVSLFQ